MKKKGGITPPCRSPSKRSEKKHSDKVSFEDFAGGFPGKILKAVIHLELYRMGRHAEGGQLFLLERHVGVQHVVREHAAAREEFAVLVELLQRLLERMAHLGHARGELRRQIVQILVDRVSGIYLVLYAVQSRHHHGGECEIRV